VIHPSNFSQHAQREHPEGKALHELVTRLPLAVIRLDGGTQPRASINDDTVRNYTEALNEGAQFPPLIVFYDGESYWLADGFHRVQAAKTIGWLDFAVVVHQGALRDAVLYSVGANATHGLQRTNDDKRRAVERLLRDEEWRQWANREIARRCGVSEALVRSLRSKRSDEDQSQQRIYITKHGTPSTMDTGHIGKGHVEEVTSRAADAEQMALRAQAATTPHPSGQYSCIVIDPPWPMEKIERDERPNQVQYLDYPTTVEEIQALPIARLAATGGCHLYLWTTQRFLPAALKLIEAWDFSYQCVMPWVKTGGMTLYSWMSSVEFVVFAHRGGLKLLRDGLKLSIEAPATGPGHSVKPDAFYEKVLQASPGPRLDMFARQTREGFTAWGDEVQGL
jgi:N6-adenosine-specific RNA methylase IME4